MFNYFLLPELTNSKLAHTIQSKRFLFYFISLLLNQHVSGLMRSWMQHKQQGPLMKPGRSKCRYGSCYSVNLLRIHICLYSTSKLQLVWSSWWIICHWQTEEGHVASAEVTLVPAEPQRKNSSVEETEGSDEMKTMQSWQQEIKQGLCVEEHAHDKDSSLLHTFWTVLKRMLISWYLTKKKTIWNCFIDSFPDRFYCVRSLRNCEVRTNQLLFTTKPSSPTKWSVGIVLHLLFLNYTPLKVVLISKNLTSGHT